MNTMRELKFRLIKDGKIVGYERWVHYCWEYSYDGLNWNERYIIHDSKDEYTGRKDKNGRDVYEGDVLASVAELDSVKVLGEISYTNGAFMATMPFMSFETALYSFDMSTVEVIGNIYENPELVKEGYE